jgi:phosphatidylglycerol---prolipoprotein diacylglyceryl transferase
MFIYPNINPVAFSIGPIEVHWYGLMYLVGFASAWGLALFRVKRYQLDWTKEQVSDLIFYAALGVIIGGRLGYMFFYVGVEFILRPWILFKLWDGGMSFHGGLLGVIISLFYFSSKFGKTFWAVADFAVPLVPIGIAAGRLGNFINGELWGRVTSVPWAMIYPHVDDKLRHPSQLYEFFLEGIVLFILVWWYARKPRKSGAVSAVFLVDYGILRLIAETFRQPDSQLGYIAFGWLTMGQLLSLPMIIAGLAIFAYIKKKHDFALG